MVAVCFYFQVHQPRRVRKYTVFDIGKNHNYFDEDKNREIALKVANKCYLPMNKLLLELLEKHPEFKISFSITGTALEQFEEYAPEVIESFKKLAKTGRVEFLSETYYHSLSALYDKEEFLEQVRLHKEKMLSTIGVAPSKIFRNTELIYNDDIGFTLLNNGYKGVIIEGADKILGWRSPNYLYQTPPDEKGRRIKLLLKNYRLSDDIAFRFSNQGWEEYPLTVDKYAQWINAVNGDGELIGLYMDYETFGEHQWESTGIFEFMKALPAELLKHPDNRFITPSEAEKELNPVGELSIKEPISWADLERDTSAWLGNEMQRSAMRELYSIKKAVFKTGDEQLINDWRLLTTSDHFYYMCTKWFSDGDVHKYFNPYDTPYDSFINMMNIMNDLAIRITKQLEINKSIVKRSERKAEREGVKKPESIKEKKEEEKTKSAEDKEEKRTTMGSRAEKRYKERVAGEDRVRKTEDNNDDDLLINQLYSGEINNITDEIRTGAVENKVIAGEPVGDAGLATSPTDYEDKIIGEDNEINRINKQESDGFNDGIVLTDKPSKLFEQLLDSEE